MTKTERNIKTIDIEVTKKRRTLSEISQAINVMFGFATTKKQILQCCKCRDFLHDQVRASLINQRQGIYGMVYDPKVDPPIDLRLMRMVVEYDRTMEGPGSGPRKIDDDEFWNVMFKAVEVLRLFEALTEYRSRTNVKRVKEAKRMAYFTSPRLWIRAPHMVSLYTLIIRLCARSGICKRNFKTAEEFIKAVKDEKSVGTSDNDIGYANKCADFMITVVKRHRDLELGSKGGMANTFYNKMEIGSFHNRMGIVSLCKAITAIPSLNDKAKEVLGIKKA